MSRGVKSIITFYSHSGFAHVQRGGNVHQIYADYGIVSYVWGEGGGGLGIVYHLRMC